MSRGIITRLVVSLVVWLAVSLNLSGQQRRVQVRPMAIKDAKEQQVGLYQASYALVIGVSNYTAGWPDLPSVVGESQQVAQALEENGFQVQRVLDPDYDQLKQSLEQFIDQYGYEGENRLLIFFSGHGHSRKEGDKGYLVPTDAPDPTKDEKGFLRRAITMDQVQTWSRQMEAKHVLFLFDSCFSGTIFRAKSLPSVPPHITAETSKSVRQYISAGEAGQEVPAKSVFTPLFIKALKGEGDLSGDGYITGTELGLYLREQVSYYSRQGQRPQYGKIREMELDQGDFVFEVWRAREGKGGMVESAGGQRADPHAAAGRGL